MSRPSPLRIGSFDLAARPAIVAVLAGSGAECEHLARLAAAEGADVLELRADLCKDDGQPAGPERMSRVAEQVRGAVSLPLLLTVRHRSEGGHFSGSEQARLEVIHRLLPLADAVDVELRATRELRDAVIAAAHAAGKPVVLSFHDFSRTPPLRGDEGDCSLEGIVREALAAGADVVKIAAHAETAGDVEMLTRFTAHHAGKGVVLATMSMGEAGRLSRMLNPFYGSCLTYGFVGGVATTAGQWSVRELRPVMDSVPRPPIPEAAFEQQAQALQGRLEENENAGAAIRNWAAAFIPAAGGEL